MLQFDSFRWIDHIFFRLFFFFFEKLHHIHFANSNIISNQALEKREKLFFLNNFIIFTCVCFSLSGQRSSEPSEETKRCNCERVKQRRVRGGDSERQPLKNKGIIITMRRSFNVGTYTCCTARSFNAVFISFLISFFFSFLFLSCFCLSRRCPVVVPDVDGSGREWWSKERKPAAGCLLKITIQEASNRSFRHRANHTHLEQ